MDGSATKVNRCVHNESPKFYDKQLNSIEFISLKEVHTLWNIISNNKYIKHLIIKLQHKEILIMQLLSTYYTQNIDKVFKT